MHKSMQDMQIPALLGTINRALPLLFPPVLDLLWVRWIGALFRATRVKIVTIGGTAARGLMLEIPSHELGS